MSVVPSRPGSYNVKQPLRFNFITTLNERPQDLPHILKEHNEKFNASGLKNQASQEAAVRPQEQRR